MSAGRIPRRYLRDNRLTLRSVERQLQEQANRPLLEVAGDGAVWSGGHWYTQNELNDLLERLRERLATEADARTRGML